MTQKNNNQIFKVSPFEGLILLTDSPKYTVIGVTDSFLTKYQKKESEVLKKSFFKIFEIKDLQSTKKELLALFLKTIEKNIPETIKSFCIQSLNKDEYLKNLDVSVTPILGEVDSQTSLMLSFKETQNKVNSKQKNLEIGFYGNLQENSFSAFFLTKPNGPILEANKTACELFGYSIEELRQIGCNEILDHSENYIHQKIKERLVAGKVKAELVGVKKGGIKFPIEVNSVLFSDDHGDLMASVTVTDITDRKNTENELRKSEYLLQEAQKMTKMGSWNFDFKDDKLTWSDQLYEVFGVNKETFHDTHDSFINLVVDKDRDFVRETSRQAQKSGQPFNIQYAIITPSGESKVIEEFGYSEKNENGDIERLFGTAQDVTKRKHVDEILKSSERKYRALFENNPLPMIIWDFETKMIVDCNEEATIKYGYTREEFLQLTIRDIRPKEDVYLINRATSNEAIYGKKHKEVWRHLKKNGELMHMEVTAYLITDNGRRVSLVLLNDVTDRFEYENSLKELNQKLEQHAKQLTVSNKELEQFAYVASHDLQEPLRMVTSFLSLLESKYGNVLEDRGKQYVHFAVDGAKRMRQIIIDLLEFSRVGRLESKEESLDLGELVNDVISLYTILIKESDATIEVGELPIVKSHKTLLTQVFQNLIGNGLKYKNADRAPVINISCTHIPGFWKFSVADNGIGINEQYFEKIFIIFQRLHGKDKFVGSGIGLAIVKKIINNLGGRIWVESIPDKGSVFYFTIPR